MTKRKMKTTAKVPIFAARSLESEFLGDHTNIKITEQTNEIKKQK